MSDHEGSFSARDYADYEECVHELLKQVIQKSHPCARKDEVSRALLYFLVRVANTWMSIKTLRDHSPDETLFMLDAGALLRAMLDACLQAEFIAHDTGRMTERASDYLEFEHVERYILMTKVLNHKTALADRLKSSSRREVGEANAQQEYDRVKRRYFGKTPQSGRPAKGKQKTRNTWYSGSLREGAKQFRRG